MGDEALRGVAVELYGLAPGDFTAVRNAEAARLKPEDRALSERVKALRKPSTAAWVVNLLVRHEAEEMTAVLDLGASLRQAQDDLDGDALRELARQRRRLVAAVAGKGRRLAADAGVKASESVLRQVEETLHAAMIDTDAEAAVRTGLLLDALSASGVGSLTLASAVAEHTGLGEGRCCGRGVPPAPVAAPVERRGSTSGRAGFSGGRSAGAGLSVVPGPDPEEQRREQRRREREEARTALRGARADESAARRDLADVERRQGELQASTLQVNGELDELRRRIDALEDRLEQLDEEAEPLAAERETAAQTLAATESASAQAQAEVDRLSD